jgi:hypothetical protein
VIPRVFRIVYALAVLILVIGHFLPWVRPASAALSLSAHELAVFTNYTPHAGVFFNEGFLLPLWAAAVMVAAAARRRILPFLSTFFLLFLSMPGYPELRRMWDGQGSEFTLQLIAVCVLLPACAALALQPRVRMPVLRGAALLGFAAAMVVVIGFFVVRTLALVPLYGTAIAVGAGLWMTIGAVILCLSFVVFAKIAPGRIHRQK